MTDSHVDVFRGDSGLPVIRKPSGNTWSVGLHPNKRSNRHSRGQKFKDVKSQTDNKGLCQIRKNKEKPKQRVLKRRQREQSRREVS